MNDVVTVDDGLGSMRRAARSVVVSLSAAAVLCVGCASATPEEPSRPIDVAEERLSEFVSAGTRISGFTVSTTRLIVVAGSPPIREQLYPVPDETRRPVPDPAEPLWVRAGDFPLAESVRRAQDLTEQCEDWGTVDVWALSENVVTTRASCERDGEVRHTVLLDDATLPSITDPFSAETLPVLWSEIEAAGVSERIVRVIVDRADDAMLVQFGGPDRDRIYQWSRGLDQLDSMVMSHPFPAESEIDLEALPAERVATALDELLATADAPELIERIEVGPDPSGDGVRLSLLALDGTEVASKVLDD